MRSSPVSVLLVAESLTSGNGGINRVARLTARVLHELAEHQGFAVEALTLNDTQPVVDLGIPVHYAAGSRSRFVMYVQAAAFRKSHFIYDVLGMARAHLLARYVKRRMACWIHGVEIWLDDSVSRRRARLRRIALAADTLFANSETTIRRSGLSQAFRCWLSTERNDMPINGDITNRPKRVLLVSRVDEAPKGHREMLNCWGKVIQEVPDAKLTFAGKGPSLADLRKLVSSHPSSETIEVLGFVPEGELEALYASSRVFAMPSRCEGFGLVYIEAMRHGLPVIGSIHDAANEINVHGLTGFNVSLDDPHDLPQRIVTLLKDPDLASEMGCNGQRRWQENFSYNCFRERFRPLVHRFLEM